MSRFKIKIFLLFVCAWSVVSAKEHHTEIRLDFRVNNPVIELSYRDNANQLSKIITFLKETEQDSTITLRKVSFCGSVSPEGSTELNRKLARARLQSLEDVVRAKAAKANVAMPDSIIYRNDSYISWEYLEEQVVQSILPHKEDILEVLHQNYDSDSDYPINRIAKLRSIDEGRVWYQLLDLYFPDMRNACVLFEYDKQEAVIVPEIAAKEIENTPETVATTSPALARGGGDFGRSIRLKTNALEWVLASANISAEIDIARHLSFAIPIRYSAINYFVPTIKFRTLSTYPELRYWFKEDNSGIFLGAHFGAASYNFAFKGKYRYQDHNGKSPAIGGGLSFGYRMPISKNERWNMEFILGVGAYSLHYDKFYNIENGRLIGTYRTTYWGIDNAAINISYRFDLKQRER